jgi:hypothetical protein
VPEYREVAGDRLFPFEFLGSRLCRQTAGSWTGRDDAGCLVLILTAFLLHSSDQSETRRAFSRNRHPGMVMLLKPKDRIPPTRDPLKLTGARLSATMVPLRWHSRYVTAPPWNQSQWDSRSPETWGATTGRLFRPTYRNRENLLRLACTGRRCVSVSISKPLVHRRRRACGLIDSRKRKRLVQDSIIYQACRSSFPDENPDWRQSYRHIKNWPDEAIAFEFLRRNVAYWDLVRQLYSLPEDPMRWPRLRLETTVGLLPDTITYQKLTKLAAKQFGVFNCCDPRLPCFHQGLWTVEASISARYTYSTVLGLADGALQYRFTQPPRNTVTIDLLADGPIEPQIDYVRWILANARKKLGLAHRKSSKASAASDARLPSVVRRKERRCK